MFWSISVMSHQRLAIGLLLVLVWLSTTLTRPSQAAPLTRFFPETGQAISSEIFQFWNATPNALQVLGYPISAPFIQESSTDPGVFLRVQYFERAVLEEHLGRQHHILVLGRLLGNELIVNRRHEPPFQPSNRPSGTSSLWDDVTRHTIANAPAPFREFYENYGGLRVFGRPTSEQFREYNRDTGAVHWVQYFERQRMEWHPEITDPSFQVMLGRLGDEYRLAHIDRLDQTAFAQRSPDETPDERMRYGINATLFYTDRDRALNLTTQAGLNWVRQQVHWKDHQSADGRIAWGELDAIVASAQAKKVKLFLSVLQAPDWATGIPGVAGLPDQAHFDDYAAFVGALAERYRGKVQAYQVWNEINLPAENGLQPIPNADYYIELLAQAYTAIKAADPQALVISTSLAPSESDNPTIAVSDLKLFRTLFAQPRFWSHVDAVGVHVFGCANPPETLWPSNPGSGIGWTNSREFYFRRVEDIRRAMVESGHGDRQIWITEFGWATANNTPGHEFGNQVSFDQQANYLLRAFEMGRYEYSPWVGAMFVWNLNFAVSWQNAGNSQHQMAAYGILNGDWTPRPAYTAIQRMAKP
jgi:GH35 family endo-1,4-beta-xylanase